MKDTAGQPTAPAEEEIPLPLPERFRKAYEAELGNLHQEADSAPFRQVWQHVTSGRTTAPCWLLGPLADVAALLVDVAEESDAPAATRAYRRLGAVELLALLGHHGAYPWPRTGHGVRPWGDEAAHCEDCAERIGHRAPITGRCGAALPTDPTPCTGRPVVTVLDSSNTGAHGCEHHAARLLAALDGGRPVALPDAPDGAALRVFRAAAAERPARRTSSLRELATGAPVS
ncbi:hypothetical protein [Streptomyces sp. NPDC017260]|uniref:hypothetical protein n=1 Tax=unclassified Streptomyces TaxID=2593676 RepID=UPI0037941515